MSILFKAQDSLTQEVQKMRESVKKFGKDIADYKSIQDKAFKEKAELQLDFRKAKDELKELAKLEKDGVEGSKEAFISKQKQINEMQEGIKRYTQVINEANKAERDLTTTKSRNSNNPNAKSNKQNELAELGQNLVKAGMFKELGQSFGNAAGTYLTSAYGDKFGNRVGTMASSIISTAGMGGAVGGLHGAIAGAGVGAVKGALDLFSEEQKTKDSYFQDGVKNVIQEVKELKPDINRGIELAGQREIDLISFDTLFGGRKNTDKYFKEADKFAQTTPFSIQDINQNAKIMKVFGWKQEEIFDKLTKIGDASASMGLSNQDRNNVITALGRMKATDKTSLEYINQLTERGIDAVGFLAKQIGTDKKKVYEMISKGVISGEKASETIIKYMGQENKGAMEKQSKTYEGLVSIKQDNIDNNLREGAKAYTEYRKKFIQSEIDWENKWGQQIAENEAKLKAKMETTKNKLVNQYLEETMKTDEYKKAQQENNGAELGRLEMEAKTKAIIEFNNSPEMKAVQENELATIKATQQYIRENGGFVELGQSVAEQFNQGWKSKIRLEIPKPHPKLQQDDGGGFSFKYGFFGRRLEKDRRATGGRIPDDYYPIYADKNERVLTAQENLEWEKNKGKSNIINNINVNVSDSNANADDIADVVVQKINSALENVV
ncbi:tape measure protein [Clostridium cochlearium]|uniref:tape measure protein n=1 Tax=Clostridium cochlearium TaxID=1494 RepID=UPI000BBC0BFA|nr:tape measure protein [Clostridium cochlearium]